MKNCEKERLSQMKGQEGLHLIWAWKKATSEILYRCKKTFTQQKLKTEFSISVPNVIAEYAQAMDLVLKSVIFHADFFLLLKKKKGKWLKFNVCIQQLMVCTIPLDTS